MPSLLEQNLSERSLGELEVVLACYSSNAASACWLKCHAPRREGGVATPSHADETRPRDNNDRVQRAAARGRRWLAPVSTRCRRSNTR
jgi:hypothetical protein